MSKDLKTTEAKAVPVGQEQISAEIAALDQKIAGLLATVTRENEILHNCSKPSSTKKHQALKHQAEQDIAKCNARKVELVAALEKATSEDQTNTKNKIEPTTKQKSTPAEELAAAIKDSEDQPNAEPISAEPSSGTTSPLSASIDGAHTAPAQPSSGAASPLSASTDGAHTAPAQPSSGAASPDASDSEEDLQAEAAQELKAELDKKLVAAETEKAEALENQRKAEEATAKAKEEAEAKVVELKAEVEMLSTQKNQLVALIDTQSAELKDIEDNQVPALEKAAAEFQEQAKGHSEKADVDGTDPSEQEKHLALAQEATAHAQEQTDLIAKLLENQQSLTTKLEEDKGQLADIKRQLLDKNTEIGKLEGKAAQPADAQTDDNAAAPNAAQLEAQRLAEVARAAELAERQRKVQAQKEAELARRQELSKNLGGIPTYREVVDDGADQVHSHEEAHLKDLEINGKTVSFMSLLAGDHKAAAGHLRQHKLSSAWTLQANAILKALMTVNNPSAEQGEDSAAKTGIDISQLAQSDKAAAMICHFGAPEQHSPQQLMSLNSHAVHLFPIHIAAILNDTATLQYLLTHGHQLDMRVKGTANTGDTAAHYLGLTGNANTVELIVNAGLGHLLYVENKAGVTPIQNAMNTGNVEFFNAYLQAVAEKAIEVPKGFDIATYATRHIKTLDALLNSEHKKFQLNHHYKDGKTLLIAAIEGDHKYRRGDAPGFDREANADSAQELASVAAYLMDANADFAHVVDESTGFNAFETAIVNNNLELAKKMYSQNSDCFKPANQTRIKGMTLSTDVRRWYTGFASRNLLLARHIESTGLHTSMQHGGKDQSAAQWTWANQSDFNQRIAAAKEDGLDAAQRSARWQAVDAYVNQWAYDNTVSVLNDLIAGLKSYDWFNNIKARPGFARLLNIFIIAPFQYCTYFFRNHTSESRELFTKITSLDASVEISDQTTTPKVQQFLDNDPQRITDSISLVKQTLQEEMETVANKSESWTQSETGDFLSILASTNQIIDRDILSRVQEQLAVAKLAKEVYEAEEADILKVASSHII